MMLSRSAWVPLRGVCERKLETEAGRMLIAGVLVLSVGCQAPEFATGAGPASDETAHCDPPGQVPDAVVEQLHLDEGFYRQHCSVFGFSVLASELVPRATMELATHLTEMVLASISDDLRDAIHDRYLRVVIVAGSAGEELDQVPELAGIGATERAAAGLGPDPEFPAATIRDSTIVCRPASQDVNATPPGETIVHELGHAVLSMGLDAVDPGFRPRLEAAYRAAGAAGTWDREVPPAVDGLFGPGLPTDNYLMSNPEEYWAVGVAAWFGFSSIPVGYGLSDDDPPHLQLLVAYGREAIRERDADLAELLAEVFGPEPNTFHHCPAWIPG